MNAVEIFAAGVTIVFLTLGILAIITYLIGKIVSFLYRKEHKDESGVAAIVAKLHLEGKL